MKKVLIFAAVMWSAVICVSQSQPNLENGFKAYGSYDGGKFDTVNLMNGNLVLDLPAPFHYPQRGSLDPRYSFYLTSKNWTVQCITLSPDLGGGLACQWTPGVPANCVLPFALRGSTAQSCAFPSGASLTSSLNLTVKRTLEKQYTGVGPIVYDAFGYSLVTADLAVHGLFPVAGTADPILHRPTRFQTMDTSGYHVEISNPDANGVMTSVKVTDRAGNVYAGTLPDSSSAISGFLNPWDGIPPTSMGQGGTYMPLANGSGGGNSSDYLFEQLATFNTVTDPNGNLFNLATGTDTLGKTMPAPPGPADTTDCVSPYAISHVGLYGYYGPNGTNQIKFCYSSFPVYTSFSQSGIAQAQSSASPGLHQTTALDLVATIVLPDKSKWTFNYDGYGEVTTVGLPLGGAITYTWTEIAFQNCSGTDQTQVSRAVATRTVTDNNGHSFQWRYTWGGLQPDGSMTNTVTDPLGNDTVHIFTGGCNAHETTTKYFQGAAASGPLLKKTDTTYSSAAVADDTNTGLLGNFFAIDVLTTVYPSGKISKVHREPDPGMGANAPIFGNVVKEQQFDWGAGAPGPLLRETDNVYKWQKNGAYLTANMLDLPDSSIVIDPVSANNIKSACPLTASAAAACMAETDYFYDEFALQTNNGGIPPATVGTPAAVRGNQTSVKNWLNTSSSFLTSQTKWYDTGEPYQKIDPLLHATTLTYDAAYKGAYVTQTCPPPTASGAITHCVSGSYDLNSGVLLSFTDQNNQTSNYSYDLMFRLTQAQAPPDAANSSARATTSFQFPVPISLPFTVTRSRSVTNTAGDFATSFYDGLGRVTKTQHTMPSGPPATVDTTYDAGGRVATVSNPYFTTSELTYGITQTFYDALDRPVLAQKPDGSFSTVTYQDNCTLAEDEAGKGRRTCTDALGRLIEVEEPGDSSAPAPTDTSTVSTQATAIVNLSGAEQSVTVQGDRYCAMWNQNGDCVDWEIDPPTTTYDAGTVSVTVNSHATSTTYGAGDTVSSLASRLASAINADTLAVVTASSSGAQITLTAKAQGQTGDYTDAFSTPSWDTADFASPSFTGVVSNLRLLGGADLNQFAHTYLTLYNYDALGNLLCVEQHGNVAPGSPNATGCASAAGNDAASPWRVRRFTYDSLGRLLTAKNPEAGTIAYAYDADGNLTSKTDARGITVNYSPADLPIDELHRVRKKTYSNNDPAITFTYDTGSYAKGKLSSLTDAAGSASYTFDPLGRMTTESRMIYGLNNAQITKSLSYSYNLGGSLKTLTYPSGAVVTYTPWTNGSIGVEAAIEAKDTGNNINYVTAATYGPDGAITGFKSGQSASFAGITSTFSYNKRLQPINMSASAPSQTVFSIGYDFHLGNGTSGADNGNVFGITNYKDSNRNQTFTYDALNRLISAQNAGTNCAVMTVNGKTAYWGNSYVYDAWGNLYQKNVTKCSAENLSISVGVNNRISTGGYVYDPAGNMTSNATDGVTATFDAESRIATAAKSGVTTAYVYDSDGNRVKKFTPPPPASNPTGTLYWYMTPGIVAESDLSGATKSEYVFFNGERVARRDGVNGAGGVFYSFSDHLKTASVITDSGGNVKAESDYYPWGGELQFVNADSNHYKFTGKERDTETGLDYFGARYYSNGLGRFVTPDWAAKAAAVPYAEFADPQSLNLYSYVRNIPTTNFDPDGHCPTCFVEDVVEFVAEHPRVAETVAPVVEKTAEVTAKVVEVGGKTVSTVFGVVAFVFTFSQKTVGRDQDEPHLSSNGGQTQAHSEAPTPQPQARRKYKKGARFSKKTAADRKNKANGRCEYCSVETLPGRKSTKGVPRDPREGTTDHYEPRSGDGTNDPSNARHACLGCNQSKSNLPPEQWEEKRKK